MMTRAGRHPNLVAFHGWFMDEAGLICLVLGLCEGGTLGDLLKVCMLMLRL